MSRLKYFSTALFVLPALAAIKPANITKTIDDFIERSENARSHLQDFGVDFSPSTIGELYRNTTEDVKKLTAIVNDFAPSLEGTTKPLSIADQALACLDFYRFTAEEEALKSVILTLVQLDGTADQRDALKKSVSDLAETLVKRFWKPLVIVLPACSLGFPQTVQQDLLGLVTELLP
ncbi:hypothetical protein HJFPF1_06877 [Paramyrothecium foliicola]|nr:hypothetical protein HJFPF1_06877 [Paramyrothecium foliicola]